MDRARAVRVSKLVALGLRHDPARLGLSLDSRGWAAVEAVLAGLTALGEPVSQDELEEIVESSDKQRFALSADGMLIRANQGHSIAVDLGLPPCEPPEILFHGTVERFLASIREGGLVRGARTHVHLSENEETARIVAARRAGRRVILRVRAREMWRAGHAFYLSENGVWLADAVPAVFLDVPSA